MTTPIEALTDLLTVLESGAFTSQEPAIQKARVVVAEFVKTKKLQRPPKWSQIEAEIRAQHAPKCPLLPLRLLYTEFVWQAAEFDRTHSTEAAILAATFALRVREMITETIETHKSTPLAPSTYEKAKKEE